MYMLIHERFLFLAHNYSINNMNFDKSANLFNLKILNYNALLY